MTFNAQSLKMDSDERIVATLRLLVDRLRERLAECPAAYAVALYVRDTKDGSELLFAAGYSPLLGIYKSTAINAICFNTKAEAEKLIRDLKLPDNVRAEARSYVSLVNDAINQAKSLIAHLTAKS